MSEQDFKQTLWKAADKLRAQMDAAEYKHIVLGLIFLKYISDTFVKQQEKIRQSVSDPSSDYFISENPTEYAEELEERDYYTQDNVFWVPQEARWETLRSKAKQPDIGSLVDGAMTAIENENTSLRGKLDKRFGRAQLGQGVLGELIDLISTIGFADKYNSSDLLGEVYEYFLGQFASAEGKKGGQFYTPSHVVKTLVAVLSPNSGRVYDPCCGSGGMFVQSDEFIRAHGGRLDDISIYGQESNPTTWRLAAMNLAIRGFSADLGKEPGDTFGHDQFPDLKFDYIMANPPFNISDWGGEKYESDPRWKFGRPPVGNANYAWLQHMLWKLRPGGQAGVVLANGSMNSNVGGEDQIRKAMVRGDVVEVMIALPGKLFLNTPIPVCLWFLTNDKTVNGRDRRGETLFIDARKLGTMITRTLRVFTDDDIAKIQSTVQSWKLGDGYDDALGFCKSASLEEIEKSGFVLTPGRYVGALDVEDDGVLFEEKIEDLTEKLLSLQQQGNSLDNIIQQNLNLIKGN
ncbi:type I restriction-modification system subunit M [Paracoccaceae bacterium]|nr:type I restriction-modification system subunit M [Paracoccaceae bacterium]